MYATLDDLRSQLGGRPQPSAAYRAKMLHDIPKATAVDREAFIVEHCRGKHVLEFGASGRLHQAIIEAARTVMGVDKDPGCGITVFDLDDVTYPQLPAYTGTPEIIICGEVLEHLSNPGWFLTRLHHQFAGVPLIVSVPNAFCAAGATWIKKGVENVNRDHVAWYSPKTLSVLLERAGYRVGLLFWYGGDGPTAEGLIVAAE